jgi:hypothetical protein
MFRNKIKNEFLAYFLMIYIERKLAENIDLDSIIDEFYSTRYRRIQLWYCNLFVFFFILYTLNLN